MSAHAPSRDPSQTGGVFAIPPGADFARTFAEGFHARFGQTAPLSIARTRVLTNTSRTLRAVEDALLDATDRSVLLPKMGLITDFATDLTLATDLAPPINPMRRVLHLTRLVERFLASAAGAGERVAPLTAAPDLAAAMALLIDQVNDAGIAFEALDAIAASSALTDGQARHWDRMMAFLDIVRRAWPDLRRELEGDAPDPRARQRAAINAQIAAWEASPPTAPVIAAGSTGSVGSTAELLAAIARLENGFVVLPGFDPEIEPEIWQAAAPDHPFGPFRGVLGQLEISPADVAPWHPGRPSARRALIHQALRPAPVTDHWFDAADDLRPICAEALADVTLIEADSPGTEAAVVALAIREALAEPDQVIAMVTPDAALARRVTAELDRFGIEPDDSLGRPLAQSPPGVLTRLTMEVATGRSGAVDLVAMLTHPLVTSGAARGDHLGHARAYELAMLRRIAQDPASAVFPDWGGASEAQRAWHTQIAGLLGPMQTALCDARPFAEAVTAHRALLEALTTGPDGGAPTIWDGAAGVALQAFFDRVEAAATAYGPISRQSYPALIEGLMRGEQIRTDPVRPHPRVSIWGPREARVLSADVINAAGLNDGVWPAPPDPDPWLSRPMRAAVGLPQPEAQIGLSAHDFLQAVCQKRVIMSRAAKAEGSPTVASRWLIRLENLVTGIGAEDAWKAAKTRGDRLLALATAVTRPVAPVPRADRPRPEPPLDARPRKLSVTQLETLVRDAYAIYARHILRLSPLDPLDRPPDARDRGIVIHAILERFAQRTDPWPGDSAARQILDTCTHEVLAKEIPWPDLRRTWQARIARAADWLIRVDAAHRAAGTIGGLEVFGELSLNLPGGPFRLTAKADRIDQRGQSGVVLDYKSGSPPTMGQIEAGFNQQLHVQGAMLAAGGFAGVPALHPESGRYIGLTGSQDGGKATDIDDLASEITTHMERLAALLAAYDAGAPYIAQGMALRSDWEGDYDHLARRAEWEDGP
ncbi:MAG: double-strand break repair protein AddB [Pseudomonadota bacterium]